MEFLIFWLGTSIASFGMEIANELRMFKDVADAGYKIDMERLTELGKELNPNATKVTLLSILVPGVNIMQVFQRANQYNNIRAMVLDQLHVIDALEEMTETEKEEYLKNPTGFNALFINLKKKIRLAQATSLEITVGEESSKIYYELGATLNDITILKVEGSASKLTEEEQKQMVINSWRKLAHVAVERYGSVENFVTAVHENNNISLNSDLNREHELQKETETMPNPIINSQRQFLKNLKSDLEEQKSQIDDLSLNRKK